MVNSSTLCVIGSRSGGAGLCRRARPDEERGPREAPAVPDRVLGHGALFFRPHRFVVSAPQRALTRCACRAKYGAGRATETSKDETKKKAQKKKKKKKIPKEKKTPLLKKQIKKFHKKLTPLPK